MNTLVVFDSQFGNTEKIARQIAETLAPFGKVRTVRVTEVGPNSFDGIDLLVIGSPTQAWNSTNAMKDFFAHLNPELTHALVAAVFDTRVEKPRWITGSAAYAMAKQLKRLGVTMLLKPECFLVTGMEGPLAAGETNRAAAWALTLRDEFETRTEPRVMAV